MFLLHVYMVKNVSQNNPEHCIESTQIIEDIRWIFRTSRILVYVYFVLRSPFAASVRDNGYFLFWSAVRHLWKDLYCGLNWRFLSNIVLYIFYLTVKCNLS